MSRPSNLNPKPGWSVRTMTLGQVPLVVSWIAAIDPDAAMNEIEIAARMEREIMEASDAGLYQYFIGYFERFATFFMVGARVGVPSPVARRKDRRGYDYEILTLLVSPVITEDLYLPLFHQAVGFAFSSGPVGRVICQVGPGNDWRLSILLRLGFYEIGRQGGHGRQAAGRARGAAGGQGAGIAHRWYACTREAFLGVDR